MLLLATAWTPDLDQWALIRALSVRDPEPTCAEAEALVADPVDTLRHVVANAEQPPWLPMRAARCLLQHPEGDTDADEWVRDPKRRGLALLALHVLDDLPAGRALPLATAALEGPHRGEARRVLGASAHPELRALVAR